MCCAEEKTRGARAIYHCGTAFQARSVKEKLKPIAVGRSKKAGQRLRMGINLPCMVVGHFLFR